VQVTAPVLLTPLAVEPLPAHVTVLPVDEAELTLVAIAAA
jgi:hypothetical protein